MNLEAYSYFEALALDRNVTRTAQKVGLTQQALSAQISRLERYYGVKLFDREKHFELTYAGERLLEYCRQLNALTGQVNSEMRDIAQGDRGIITIGATAKRGYAILPTVFQAFKAEWPNVRVDVLEARANELIQDVLDQRTDFCFLVNKSDNPRIASIPIFEERVQLFVSDSLLRQYCAEYYDEIMARRREELPIRYFANCPFLLQGNVHNRVRSSCSRLFEKYNIVPDIVFTSTNALNLLEIARRGLGAAFLVSSTQIETEHTLHRFFIQDLSVIEHLRISYLNNHYLSRAARRFIELSQEILPRQVAARNEIAELL